MIRKSNAEAGSSEMRMRIDHQIQQLENVDELDKKHFVEWQEKKTCSEWVQDREETALGTESKIILNGFYFKNREVEFLEV